ncbi:MAG: hypothetical protein HXY43_14845 [Fischerella sp.]|uniref:hypothetical protein n=1 Tax=Fischerella sp. TaxID=1191 RepID=UPI001839434D|nr:hypothetical protein [Fischerella sp.]NWF60497.1 hypothetical protein [Fischerella sp.]
MAFGVATKKNISEAGTRNSFYSDSWLVNLSSEKPQTGVNAPGVSASEIKSSKLHKAVIAIILVVSRADNSMRDKNLEVALSISFYT